MRDVIIASANRKSAEHIKSILQRDLLFVSEIYQSGAEVLSYASIRPDAVVVCGRLSDGLPAVSLAETLPPGFDVVHLVSSSDAYQGFVSNMVELTMPLDRVEFVLSCGRLLSFRVILHHAKKHAPSRKTTF